jgi:hypothetical protein
VPPSGESIPSGADRDDGGTHCDKTGSTNASTRQPTRPTAGIFDNTGDVPHTEQPAAVLPTATRVRGQHDPAAADRQALRRHILGVVTGPAEALTSAIAR